MRKGSRALSIHEVVSIGAGRDAVPCARIGSLVGLHADGSPLVDYPGNPAGPLPAVIAGPMSHDDLRAAVSARGDAALLFDEGDPLRPILVGLVNKPAHCQPDQSGQTIDIRVDGQSVSFRAQEEISFHCGDASISLRKDGKIVIRGAFVESHATGTNRIKGAAVKIN
jgi:hypothetical protein